MIEEQIKNDFLSFCKSTYPNNHSAIEDYIRKNGLPRMSYISPTIIEERELHIAQMDCFSRLMMDRIIFFGTEVNSDSANIIVSQLLYLNSCDPDRDINIYINSPGGSVYDGMSILDTMASIKADVATNCTGLAASFGAMILSCGARGKRTALPHSRIMIHQPSGGAKGKATDIEIDYKEIMLLKKELESILAQRTNQDPKKIAKDLEKDKWMSAEEAMKYGIIDEIVKINWD